MQAEHPPQDGGGRCVFEHNGSRPTPNQHHDQHDQNHHPENPRELHSAESLKQYLHEDRHAGQNGDYKESFRDYLEAQRYLKKQRSMRMSTMGSTRKSTMGSMHHVVEQETGEAASNHTTSSPSRNKHRQATLRALGVLGMRQSTANNSEEWQNFLRESAPVNHGGRDFAFDELKPNGANNNGIDTKIHEEEGEEDNEEEHHDHRDHHDLSVPWYCRPVQRQRWDDDQILPHVNWGDLFFDLFYVAAAYNVGNTLISALGTPGGWPRGVVYFIGIFGPLYHIWENDVVYSSRYTLVDSAHRLVSVIRFLCVCFAVLSIKPISVLGDKHSAETFTLVTALFLESMIQLGLNLELYWYADGDRMAIQNHTYRKIVFQFVPASVTYLVASIVAGISLFVSSDDTAGYGPDYATNDHDEYEKGQEEYDISHDDHYSESDGAYANSTTAYNDTDHHDDGHFRVLAAAAAAVPADCSSDGHRMLAGGADPYEGDDGCGGYYKSETTGIQWTIADVPLILCMGIYLINILWTLYRKYGKREQDPRQSGRNIRQNYVPSNIDYMIHRYGEWIMLMIGESILSLLIVETIEAQEYYGITALGCLTVIVIQTVKFESEPSHSDGHALWRSMFAGQLFSLLIQVLSVGLIAFGVSYKIMLTNVLVEQLEVKVEDAAAGHRMLAAVPNISDKAVASLFCGSLTIVLLSLEMMLGTHKGVTKSYQLLFHEIETLDVKALNWPLMFISVFKIGLIVFTATLSQWDTEPEWVALVGFLIVTAMATTRIVGWGFVHHEEKIMDALTMVKDQAADVGRDLMYQATDAMYATQHIAKKTIRATASFGGLSAGSVSVASRDEFDIQSKALWDASFDAVVVTDRAGVIKYINKQGLLDFGYSSVDELGEKNVSVLVGGGDAGHHHLYTDLFNKNEQRETTIGKQRKLQARRKNGEEFACLVGIKEVPSTGLLIVNTGLVIVHIRSLSEIIQPQLESSTNPIPIVDDTSFDSIIAINPTGVILNVNLTCLSEFGYPSKDELLGENISILVGGGEAHNHDLYLSNFDAQNRDEAKVGDAQRVVQAKRKDGTEFTCVIGVKRSPDSDNLIGHIRNLTGITPEDIALKEKMKDLVDDTAFDSILVTDQDGAILACNATAIEMFAYNAKAELVGKNISILVGGGHAKHHGRYMKRFQKKRIEDTAIGKRRALRARRMDGTEFGCVIGIRKVPETDYLIGYIRSTEGLSKKQIAAEYDNVSQLSTARSGGSVGALSSHHSKNSTSIGNNNQDILDESFDAIVVTTLSGKIKKVNQTVLDIFRYQSKDELVGQNVSLLVGGGDANKHDKYLEKFQSEGKSESQIGKQRVLYSKRKDGTEFPCIVGIKRTPNNDGLIGWIRDMSDVADQRSSIKITNMKVLDPLERIVDNSSFDAIIVADLKGEIKRCNQTCLREFLYSSEAELVGRNISDLVGGKVSPKQHDKYLQRFQKAGRVSSTIGKQRILKSKRKDGTEFRCIIGINRFHEAKEELLVGYIRNLEMLHEPTSVSEAAASHDDTTTVAKDSQASLGSSTSLVSFGSNS